MKHVLTEQVREAGYEALFLVGGFLALSAQPTSRNLEELFRWEDNVQCWRMHLKRLKEKGLVEGEMSQGNWVGRITESGSTVFAGGRQPEAAWGRGWDGQWRLVSFDLPRGQSAVRMKLRRWLMAQRFGRLQGSVWIGPDPIPDIGAVTAEAGVDAKSVMVFEGNLAGNPGGKEVVALAWDFEAINRGYREYVDATQRLLPQVQNKGLSMGRVRDILRADRKAWLKAVDRDPLLPRELQPAGYEGTGGWEARCGLMAELGGLVAEA